jgi:hypothetical protein
MRYFASRTDRWLWETVERWRTVARDTLHVLESWREAPDVYFEHHSGGDGFLEAVVWLFMSDTAELIQEATALSLNPLPLQAFCDAVTSWNLEHTTNRVPDQRRFLALFFSTHMILDVIEEGVRRRKVRERPKSGPQSTAPVALNGQEPTSRSDQSTTPVATKAPDPTRNGAHPITPVAPNGRKHTNKGGARLPLISVMESLIENGEWGLTNRQVALRAGVDPSTLSRLLKEDSADKLVKGLHATYRNCGLGKRRQRVRYL